MACKSTFGLILALAWLSLGVAAEPSPLGGEDCLLVRKNIETCRSDLARCVESLVKAQAQDDLAGVAALSEKIGRLVEQIRELEARSECRQDDAWPSHGVGSVKSDPAVFASKNCSELKQLRVKFLMTVNALKRRERSKFSQLNSSEKEELDRAEGDLRSVNEAMVAKCAEEKPPPLRQFLRTPGGSRNNLRR
jgi:hypothetical protein